LNHASAFGVNGLRDAVASNAAANGTPHVRSARPTIGNCGIGS